MVSRAERAASAGSRVAGRGVGAGVGTALSSPFGIGALLIGGLILALVIFRKDIGGFLGNLKFPELPSLPDIKFPDINFPDFNFPDIKFPDFNFPDIKFPDFNFPEFDFPELPDFAGLFEGFQKQFEDFKFPELPMLPPFFKEDPDTTTTSGGGFGQDPRRPPADPRGSLSPQEIANLPDIEDDLVGLTPTQRFNFIERGVIPTGFVVVNGVLVQENIITPAIQEGDVLPPSLIPVEPVRSFLLDEPTQVFEGGGVSFIGGSIFETPITADSTLSFIIDKLGVSASRAASIRAELRGFTEEEALFLAPKVITPEGVVFDAAGGGGGGVNVSNEQFAGLTPQEIALRLTGGNISNF